jgi:hypothetical protein
VNGFHAEVNSDEVIRKQDDPDADEEAEKDDEELDNAGDEDEGEQEEEEEEEEADGDESEDDREEEDEDEDFASRPTKKRRSNAGQARTTTTSAAGKKATVSRHKVSAGRPNASAAATSGKAKGKAVSGKTVVGVDGAHDGINDDNGLFSEDARMIRMEAHADGLLLLRFQTLSSHPTSRSRKPSKSGSTTSSALETASEEWTKKKNASRSWWNFCFE